MNKIFLLGLLFVSLQASAGSAWEESGVPLAKPVEVTVHRSPSCGCCGKWIEHMRNSGFVIKDIKESDMDAVKRRAGVPKVLESCHTAELGGYVVEGHVPAKDIKKMLNEKAAFLGLAAPGMPAGSPGMEMGGHKDDFSVIAFDKQGNADIYVEHKGY
ncbi:DUF411 domain-containing protein [Methyloterricola oryzae]|uniref:DUF411 domain-containing protein n=1 Tax=Methyloterricola oryzae TaxID=1495050 RepID=UPI0005EB9000|nr:DUF411 domain-containing protein [Methyloterricola oryzae]